MSHKTLFKEYKIHASKKPTEKEAQPQIFVSNIFAKNIVQARSKMTQILNNKHKIKSTNTLFLKVEEIPNANEECVIKNYGIQYVFRSRRGLHNMYKEFRGLSKCDVVGMLYQDMAGKHKAKEGSLKIVEVKELKADELKRLNVIQFTKENVSFPIFKKRLTKNEIIVNENEKYFA
ncbi:60S ribosomal protein L18A [Binucleata daphniae]